MKKLSLIIPTYRMRDVSDTVKAYQNNLRLYNHDVPIILFDDSAPGVGEEFLPGLEKLKDSALFYVGPREKSRFKKMLIDALGSEHESTVSMMLRQSYGGNRNHTVLYAVGDAFITVDDDMRPHGIHNRSPVSLKGGEVQRGRYIEKHDPLGETEVRDHDIVSAFEHTLGKNAGDVSFPRGRGLVDSMTDLYTNKTKGKLEPNIVVLSGSEYDVEPTDRIITAQTFRTGSADIDAIDYANDFLINPVNIFINDMSLRYVIGNYSPCVTKNNWRLDSGVSAFDNGNGIPPFLPTELRFEDYGFRLWLQRPGIASAHVDAVQSHYRNPYMRESLSHDIWNEEMSNFLKAHLRNNTNRIDWNSIDFGHEVDIPLDEARRIMERGRYYFQKAIERAGEILKGERYVPTERDLLARYYTGFANDLYENFDGFDDNAFYKHMKDVIHHEISNICDTMDVWPRALEETMKIKKKGKLPLRRLS